MTTTTKLALELLANGAANQTLANTTFAQLNQLVQAGVVDKDLTVAPGSPANEALYIIGTGATGTWSGKDGQLAYWLTSTGAWQYIVPLEGFQVHVNDEDVCYKYNGSAWILAEGLIPQNSKSAAYTLLLGDAGRHLLHPSADTTARTFTIPANASVPYTIGTTLTFVNQDSAGTLTIAITTDTMRLAGSGATGSRTLAANGVATALKLTSTEWIISGVGLT